MNELILASGSPRRRDILEALGIPFRVITSDIDEKAIEAARPRELAIKTAFAKALAVEDKAPRGALIVAADTIVVVDDTIFGKPEDTDDAARMLHALSGRGHNVITGVAVKEAAGTSLLDAETSEVQFKKLSDQQIAEYIATSEPMDKAGAYAVQGIGAALIAGVQGDYFNVVGLPARRLVQMLTHFMDTTSWQSKLAELVVPGFQ